VLGFVPMLYQLQETSSPGPALVGARFPPLPFSRLFARGHKDFGGELETHLSTLVSATCGLCFGSLFIRWKAPENAGYSMLDNSFVKISFSPAGQVPLDQAVCLANARRPFQQYLRGHWF
jgi:hypothetical protein